MLCSVNMVKPSDLSHAKFSGGRQNPIVTGSTETQVNVHVKATTGKLLGLLSSSIMVASNKDARNVDILYH